jgi:hypothetical protein
VPAPYIQAIESMELAQHFCSSTTEQIDMGIVDGVACEWASIREQISAEHEGNFDGSYSDPAEEWAGVHEQWTLERDAGAGPFKPEY